MFLAVFGDVHGNLDDVYRYVDRWEQRHGAPIAAVLQTGDFGAFPPGGLLDRATIKFSKRDPSELGGAAYIVGTQRASHRTVFVRGNHEDFEFLLGPGNLHIDPYGMIRHLRAGEVFRVEEGDEAASVAGLGGIAGDAARGSHDAGRKFFTETECDVLLALSPGSADVFLSHDAPKGYGLRRAPETGSEEVSLIIEHLQPRFAFYGHYGSPPDPFRLGPTLCVGMNNRSALRLPRRDGGMGIIDTATWEFTFVREGWA